MRRIGLHLRLNDTLLALVQRAMQLQLPIFQCFFVSQITRELVHFSDAEINAFIKEYRSRFDALYLHGSYWINLASVKQHKHHVFTRELELARKLEFTHMILHPGSATGGRNKHEGIDALARAINDSMEKNADIQLVLENTCHAGLSVGGDIHDFRILLEKLNRPEKLSFCIDTAHAYSYGYDVSQQQGQEEFITLLQNTIGIERIALIHLNDTTERLGSKIDRHAQMSAGNIGESALRSFVMHPKLVDIPIILELPVVSEEREQEILDAVRSWQK